MMNTPVAVLFDLDGTLIDSSGDLAVAANVMLEAIGRPAVTRTQVEGWIGHGLEPLIHRCLTQDMHKRVDAPVLKQATEVFRSAYLETGFQQTECLQDTRKLLEALMANGYVLGLVTNKDTAPTQAVLSHLQLGAFFQAVVCGDTLPVKKPDPAPILHALTLCEASFGWMVGDSETDAAASAAAGIGFIGIRGGYGVGPAPEQFSGPPIRVIESFRELLDEEGNPVEMLSHPKAFFL